MKNPYSKSTGLIFTVILCLISMNLFGYEITYTSQNNYTGLWSDIATWSYSPVDGTGEPAQPGNPTNSSAVGINVYGYIRVVSSLSVTNANPVLTIYDTLYVEGNLTLGSGARMVVEAGGVLSVTGILKIQGSFNLNNTGRIVVGQNFNVTNGSVTNANNIYVYGNTTASGGGTVNGCNPYGGCSPYATIKDENDLEAEDDSLFDFVESGGVLPIELLAFSAIVNEIRVELDWSTASELNNDYFTIERSSDGLSFEPVATVTGAGNSSETLNYSFVDRNPLFGKSYYRLKQTDFDGASETFAPIAVNFSSLISGDITFTNPVNRGGALTIYTNTDDKEILTVSVFNMTGEQLVNEKFSGINYSFDMSTDIKPGIYFVKVSSLSSE
ncbi:MAG: T9SS type A sorting domain-containing protein, partial [Fulvivirga sp.]